MPADILGTNVVNAGDRRLPVSHGPVFTDLLLVDEINRMPPRTQAALLECMEERQITVDGVRHDLSPFFTVFATQNPIDFEGTYPLPEAQLDRFLVKIHVPYPEQRRGGAAAGACAATASTRVTSTPLAWRRSRPSCSTPPARESRRVTVRIRCFGYIVAARAPDAGLAGRLARRQPASRGQPDAVREGAGRASTAATSSSRTT